MKLNILKSIIFTGILSLLLSCVNDDNYTDEGIAVKTYELVPNKLVAAISASATTNVPVLYDGDDIIEAYVTSSDETGNFFTTICFQTLPIAGAQPLGFSVSADFKSFGYGFTPGRKVFIKLKGLYFAKVDGSLKIGALFNDNGTNEIGRITSFNWNKHLFPSSTIVPESQLVTTTTVGLLNNDLKLNILTEIDNVQFGDNAIIRTLFTDDFINLGGATNHLIVDVNSTANSILRTSSFSTFARLQVQSGRGKIRGVLTKFGSGFQFYVRTIEDFKLTNVRSYRFLSALNEGFETYVTNQKIFPNYLNFSAVGTKDWQVRTGKFLEMSAFGGAIQKSKSYFMVPVNMAAANTFTFQVNVAFGTNGRGLRIYRTTDYKPGMKISNATLIDISSNFNFPANETPGFVNAGVYNIPSNVTENGFFVFEYEGSNVPTDVAVTTRIQIDNIIVN